MTAGFSRPTAEAVSMRFKLGAPLGPLRRVTGGLSHHMWRLDTSQGCFAVKELNRDFTNPDYMDVYERAFRIELAAFDAGIPMPRPVPVPDTGGCLAELPVDDVRPATVRVHEWVVGFHPSPDTIDEPMAEAIGMVLARIHHLRLTDGRSLAAILTVHGEQHWRVLAERTARAGIPWAQRLHAALPHVAELEGRVVAARSDPDPVLLTHRDADPTNTLVTPAGDLLLVDWDTASACSPRHEIAAATLDWSRAGRARTAIKRAVVCGYRRAGGDFERPEPSVFAGFCCGILNWLEYNVRRGLGERLLDPEDREIAEREVLLLLDALPRIAGSLERWSRLLA